MRHEQRLADAESVTLVFEDDDEEEVTVKPHTPQSVAPGRTHVRPTEAMQRNTLAAARAPSAPDAPRRAMRQISRNEAELIRKSNAVVNVQAAECKLFESTSAAKPLGRKLPPKFTTNRQCMALFHKLSSTPRHRTTLW